MKNHSGVSVEIRFRLRLALTISLFSHHHALLNSETKRYCLHRTRRGKKVTITCNKIMSVVGKRYTLINVCEELSGDEVTIIVFHGY